MKNALSIIIVLISTLSVKATSQVGDILIWNGDTITLFSNPLELHPDWENIKKTIANELENEDRRLYPKKYENEEVEALFSSKCWRGYVAEWKIVNSKIYLKNISACNDQNIKVNLKKVFPEEYDNGLVFANWIYDKLIAPKGACIERVNLEYKSIFEKELVFEFKNGELVKVDTYNNFISKRSKFSEDPNPSNYFNFIYSHVNWDSLPELNKKHIQVFVGIQPSKEGQIDSVIWGETYMLDGKGMVTDRNNLFIKEAVRVAKLIPDWDVVYQREMIISRGFLIVFDKNNKNKYAR